MAKSSVIWEFVRGLSVRGVLKGLWKVVRTVCLAIGLAIGSLGLAIAVAPVVDTQNLAQSVERLNSLNKQLQQLTGIRDSIQEQVDAIGEYTQIPVTVLNLDKIGRQLERDMQCLKPDFSKLWPALDPTEYQWGSICGSSKSYKDALFIKDGDEDYENLSDEEKREVFVVIRKRRETLVIDASLKAVAQGDTGQEVASALNSAADELEAGIAGAETVNARLALIAEGQAAQVRGIAQTNMLLSQLLKMQAATIIKNDNALGLPRLEDGR